MEIDKESFRKAALGFAAVTEVVVYSVCGYFIGHYFDLWIKTDPLLTVVLTFIGLMGGFYRLYVVVTRDSDQDEQGGGNSKSDN